MYDKVIRDLRHAYNIGAAERQKNEPSDWKIEERQAFFDLLQQEDKSTLLEIGAGPGKDSRFFQDNGLRVICSDLSPEMVKMCLEKGLKAYEMDFKNLDFPAESFDSVYALNCLLHVPKEDLPGILLSVSRLIKPSGLFFMAVYGGPDTEGIWEDDYHWPKRFFATYTDEQILEVVSQTFEVYDFKQILLSEDAGSELHSQRFILRKV